LLGARGDWLWVSARDGAPLSGVDACAGFSAIALLASANFSLQYQASGRPDHGLFHGQLQRIDLQQSRWRLRAR
jgi:hypothetical protein